LIYLLFYLPDIFPALNKIVVFDHDVVVQQDLSGLWNANLKGNVIAAVGTCQEGKTPFHRIDAFINFSDPLIGQSFDVNSCTWAFGVNLFDLQQWRTHDLTAVYHKYSQMVWLKNCLYFYCMILLFIAQSNFSCLKNLINSSVRLLALVRL
jgi:alpha-1,4-galacturonosyltransferase